MDMQATRSLPVTQAQAWAALNNAEVLKSCIPGCDKFELSGEHQYQVGVAIKIGPVAAKFSGTVQLKDIVAPTSYALQFDAQGGMAGFGKGECQVLLTPTDSGCDLQYTVHSKVGGKLAQLGQRLIDGAAKSLTEDFFTRFEAALAQQFSTAPVAEAAPASTEPAKAAWPLWVGGAAVLVGVLGLYWLR